MTKETEPRRPDVAQIALPRDLGRKIRTVSAALGMNIKQYAETRLREAVEKDMPRVLEQMQAAAK